MIRIRLKAKPQTVISIAGSDTIDDTADKPMSEIHRKPSAVRHPATTRDAVSLAHVRSGRRTK
ncbi:hypothetical protein [Haladaptatus litoreus]|uniref:hypothetical protein n=1 Tax=Haladaptatus litoreus TaxID=553468 RepID=UPI001115AA76|nr:hypothetical protein [Haladaptatus litoreus]